MTPQRFARLRAVLERRQPDLTLLLDNVRKAHNFSALLRTCDAVGIHQIHGVWRTAPPDAIGLTSSGAQKWVNVATHETIEQAITHLKAQSLQVVAAHTGVGCIDYRQVDYTRPTAIVLGAELDGVGEAVLRAADEHVSIAMQGMVESLNLSVAAAVVLFEAQRQRGIAGMYLQRRLCDADYTRTLFEWAHPRVAQYCRRHGLAYPSLDETGGIDGTLEHDKTTE